MKSDRKEKLKAQLKERLEFEEILQKGNDCLLRGDKEGLAALGFADDLIRQVCTPDANGNIHPMRAPSNEAAIRKLTRELELLERNNNDEHELSR